MNGVTIRQRTWQILDVAKSGDVTSRTFDIALIVIIVLNVIEVSLSSVKAINARYGAYLNAFEFVSIIIFTIEYLGRIWACVESSLYQEQIRGRIRFVFRPLSLIDLMAIVPFYLPFLGVDLSPFRLFRMLRVLRVLKLGRYSKAFHIIGRAISGKKEELVITAVALSVLLLLSASLMFFAETDAQPDRFSSIPATLWWSVVTLTTVGYGDIYPVTTIGKVIAGIISVLGIGMVALPAGIISAGFVEEISESKKEQGICPSCGRERSENLTRGSSFPGPPPGRARPLPFGPESPRPAPGHDREG
jgi:voltage-gated potassium channel